MGFSIDKAHSYSLSALGIICQFEEHIGMENCKFDRVRDRLTAFLADSIVVFKCCCLTEIVVDLEAARVGIALKVVHKSTGFMAKADLFGIHPLTFSFD